MTNVNTKEIYTSTLFSKTWSNFGNSESDIPVT